MKKKNMAIELMRIIACFLVIFAHIQLPITSGNKIINNRLLLTTFFADNVPIFLLIMGFYLFKNIENDDSIWNVYTKKIKSVLEKIYIPSCILVFVTCMLTPWINNQTTLFNAFSRIDLRRFKDLNDFIFKFQANALVGHLWYICTYVSIIFWFPFFAYICQNKPDRNKIRRIFEIMAFLTIIINDINYVSKSNFIDLNKLSIGEYALYILLGYELSIWVKNADKRKKIMAFSIYISSVMLKIILHSNMYLSIGNLANRFLWLQASLCYISSTSLFYFIYTLLKDKESEHVSFFGQRTFYIFLVHRIVVNKTGNIKSEILKLNNNAGNFGEALLYYIEYGLIVFCISLVFGYMFELIYTNILKMLHKLLDKDKKNKKLKNQQIEVKEA